uniref:Proteasome 26S subunit, ATPase 4 n=1 Tax=Rousettus aegyptiacus TaxID=9407 RepID=A0A7J8CKV0_ROUAE|nr:proteasome 26S subunit, ATPase 4 [Rousettus aegyptiacus]
MEEIGILVEKAQDEIPALSVSRPQTGLSFLGPEPEDLEDLYSRYKKLQQELEFLEVQEEYIKDEQKNLKKEFLHAQEEVKRIQSIPLVIGQFLEAVDQNTAIVGSTTGVRGLGGGGYLMHSSVHSTGVKCFPPCARNCARVLQQHIRKTSVMVFFRVF